MTTAVVEYKARDGSQIKLDFQTVKKYLVHGKPELVTDQEFMFFVGMCKSKGMNPFIKDCYLIKYTQNDSAAIITSIDYYRKRAKAQEDCQGWESGVIVQRKGELVYTNGLVLEGDKILGGWFEAKPKGWDKPFRKEVNLRSFVKKTKEGNITRFWSEDNQPGQIAKVAEAQGLRTVWGDEFQGLYVDAEMASHDAQGEMNEALGGAKEEDKPGAKVYDFKTAETKEPTSETKAPEPETKETVSETKEPEPEKKPEAPKPDLAKEQIALVLSQIKGARPKASEQAKEAFKGLYLGNRDLILSLTGSDFEYAKGKFINAGLSWENDLIGANQAQAATSPEGPANGSNGGEKAQSPGLVDFGDGGNEGEPKEEWLTKALEYRQAFTDLGPQGEKAWAGILQLYNLAGKDLGTMAPGYRDAFLKRCQGQLDMEIAKNDGGK